MALFAMADFHLCAGVADKPMDIFGGRWEGYMDKIKYSCETLLSENDVLVIPGDISWGTYTHQAIEDFKFINDLPGKKIISRGNHDFWWTTKSKLDKMLKENGFDSISFLHNNFHSYGDVAICGCRGWIYSQNEDDVKIYKRELLRLEYSLKQAHDAGFGKKLVFMHYPPYKSPDSPDENIIKILKTFGVTQCFYGHIHGGFSDILDGEYDGISFSLISADYLNFTPKKIIE